MPVSIVYPSARYVPTRVALFRDAVVADLQARLANPRTLGPPCPEPAHDTPKPKATARRGAGKPSKRAVPAR